MREPTPPRRPWQGARWLSGIEFLPCERPDWPGGARRFPHGMTMARPVLFVSHALRVPVLAARVLQAAAHRLLRFTRDHAQLDDAARLTSWAYDHSGSYLQPAHQDVGWFDFESRALREHFPPPPAHVLVIGCGAGRELLALQAAGYRVTGCDPAPRLVQAARRRMPADVALAVAGLPLLADPALQGPFAAVIIGWGAWGHVLDPAERHAALVALRSRCPHGPLLLSWAVEATPGLRAGARTVGEMLAPARQVDWRAQVHVDSRGVFHVRLSRQDVLCEAAAAGWQAVHAAGSESGYPHAVLR